MDQYERAKQASRTAMMSQAEMEKRAFAKQLKQGLGEQLTAELENIKPPTRRKRLWNKIKHVLGL